MVCRLSETGYGSRAAVKRPRENKLKGGPHIRVATISAAAATVLISTGIAFALDSSVTMTSSMSPDALWKKVGDFCASVIGTRRSRNACSAPTASSAPRSLRGGGTLVEALEAVDNANHTYTYTILSGPLPVANYHSTISVSPDPKGSSLKWVGKYDAKGAPDADAKKVIDGIYESGEKALVGG